MSADDIDRLIEKYGQPAFALAMRQTWIDFGFALIFAIALSVATIVLLTLTVRWYKQYKAHTGPSYETTADLSAMFAGMVGAATAGFGLFAWSMVISIALNPAWAALQKLLAR